MMSIDEMIAVLQAAKAGKQIQSRDSRCSEWQNVNHSAWHFAYYEYRVKPEPREWRVWISDDGRIYSQSSWWTTPVGSDNVIRVREVLPDAQRKE